MSLTLVYLSNPWLPSSMHSAFSFISQTHTSELHEVRSFWAIFYRHRPVTHFSELLQFWIWKKREISNKIPGLKKSCKGRQWYLPSFYSEIKKSSSYKFSISVIQTYLISFVFLFQMHFSETLIEALSTETRWAQQWTFAKRLF